MLKHSATLEVRKEDRVYQLQLPENAQLGEVHDVLFQMRSYIVDRFNAALEADKPKNISQEKPKEE